jgi:hypothetical protein
MGKGENKNVGKDITMSNNEKPDKLIGCVERILHLSAARPGFPSELKDKAIRAKLSGMPLYLDDKDIHVLGEWLDQVRNQLTIGELLHSISEEHLGDRQATVTDLMMIADVGVDLFYAVVAHRDVTPEVLEEARGQWGPLVDVARLMCGLGPTVI